MNSSLHDRRMRRFLGAGLYVVTSQSMSAGRLTLEVVRMALAGGVRLVQLREKGLTARALCDLAVRARALCDVHDALLIVNDRVDVALASGADGVHLGQDDFPVKAARALAPDLIIGASTHSRAEAVSAERDGASYVNIGPLFPTSTKDWQGAFLGMAGLASISAAISIPFTVMGGIKREHIPQLVAAGAHTVALVTAVTAAEDPEGACRELLAMLGAGAP